MPVPTRKILQWLLNGILDWRNFPLGVDDGKRNGSGRIQAMRAIMMARVVSSTSIKRAAAQDLYGFTTGAVVVAFFLTPRRGTTFRRHRRITLAAVHTERTRYRDDEEEAQNDGDCSLHAQRLKKAEDHLPVNFIRSKAL